MSMVKLILNSGTRTILYPNLEDNAIVKSYPSVVGMEKDVVFFNHQNKENGVEDSVSKHNMFEVSWLFRIKIDKSQNML